MKPHSTPRGIPVYVFERHSEAIIPWAQARREVSSAPRLLTIDHHTDTMRPFLRWSHWHPECQSRQRTSDEIGADRISTLDYRCNTSIADAAKDLWHDEQIQAALSSDIISEAFVIAHRSPSKDLRVSGIHYLLGSCLPNCRKIPHDEECGRLLCDAAIEDDFLTTVVGDAVKGAYIFDIDLDYFRTKQSLRPASHEVFDRLAREALCITIATESDFVRSGKLDEEVNAENSLARVLQLINQACN